MTTDESLTADAILNAFATAGCVLPRPALKQAADRWNEVGPALLALLHESAEGGNRSERADSILFFGIFLMAQMRETRAFRLLCTIAADGERMFELIGDGALEDLAGILVRIYDGDLAQLQRLIEAENADGFIRDSALETLAWLTATGQLDRDETAGYLRVLYSTLKPQADSFAWVGWQQAVARLGVADLVPLVETVFRDGRVDESVLSLDDFHADLRAAQQATEPTAVFDRHIRDIARFDDVAAHLSTWASFQPEKERDIWDGNDRAAKRPHRSQPVSQGRPQRPLSVWQREEIQKMLPELVFRSRQMHPPRRVNRNTKSRARVPARRHFPSESEH